MGINGVQQKRVVDFAHALDTSIEYLMEMDGGVGNFQQQEYYTNPETAKLADEMAVNPELKALFDVQRDMSPADLQTLYDMALALKRRAERLDSDDPC
jgi:hypothetical protein